ncbi:MAG: 50S ribosomal protein L24 [Nitrospinaceae bacterium]|nr:50S ribosomal protein L24 [Nitrospinaceae bacterium]NIR55548.1 50S ribosomal protein L24 [Nitrospinaceae bacterium]NIS85982.1 50S ribosomal protein L24 [Nitrospinaceae bacterium]NIT82828.1 50S ribosomal protein L24 [Nitrospinaceae bacterium]NIU45030.1 50S ribosomal protein L24 [Nitrospinaceae bacterium]
MSVTKLSLKKDDIVEVISGREKGKKGKVLALFQETGKLTIEKLNMVKKHMKPSAQNKQGGIVEKEGQIHISNVLLFCDKCGKGVRVKRKKLEDGKRVRVCVKCGEVMDKV